VCANFQIFLPVFFAFGRVDKLQIKKTALKTAVFQDASNFEAQIFRQKKSFFPQFFF